MILPSFATIATLLLIAEADAQTPPNTFPSTGGELSVTYGSGQVTPGMMLPVMETRMMPTFSYTPGSPNQTFTLLLVDLSISSKTLDQAALNQKYQIPLAPGIDSSRTTRLHYWQTGLTFASNGTLNNNSAPIAFYQGPAPPPGDIAHTYVFYLFPQGSGFMAPPAGNPFNVANVNMGMNRISFNVQRLANETGIGALAAANYITVQNTTGSASATASGSSSATGSSMAPTTSPFTGNAARSSLGKFYSVIIALGLPLALVIS